MTWEKNEEGLYKSTKGGYDPTTVVDAFDREVEREANQHQAVTWSSDVSFPPEREIPEGYGVIGFAKFGDQMAVNEYPVEDRPDFSDLEEFENYGGRIPTSEGEAIVETVAKQVADKFDELNMGDIIDIVEKFKDITLKDAVYDTVSGYATYYKAKKDKAKKRLSSILARTPDWIPPDERDPTNVVMNRFW